MPRKIRLDKRAVVQAAADLVNSEGIEALSLSRLAHQLGVQSPSLYNHIGGLPDLQRELALMNARALADCLSNAAIGKAGPELLHAVAQAYRGYIKAFPGIYLVSLRAAGAHPQLDAELQAEEARSVKIGLAVMASFGLQGEEAVHSVRGLRSMVHGFATLEIAGGFGLPLDCDESFHRLIHLLIRGLQSPLDFKLGVVV